MKFFLILFAISFNVYAKCDKTEIEQLIIDEGYSATPYTDTKGFSTIGYGHRNYENYKHITRAKAIELFYKDYIKVEKHVFSIYYYASCETKMVLINMAFNLGNNGLKKFKKMLYYIKKNDYESASKELLNSKYAKQVKKRATRLAARLRKIKTN